MPYLQRSHEGNLLRRSFLKGMAVPFLSSVGWGAFAQNNGAGKGMELDGKPILDFETEFLFNRRSKVRREVIGPVGEGFRLNIYVEEAEIVGPDIKGSCTVGGDWFTIRPDGMGIIDSRATIITESEEIIYTYYNGLVDLGEDAYEKVIAGETPNSGKVFVAARFQTSSQKFKWLNRIQAIGIGMNEGDYNYWSTYALR